MAYEIEQIGKSIGRNDTKRLRAFDRGVGRKSMSPEMIEAWEKASAADKKYRKSQASPEVLKWFGGAAKSKAVAKKTKHVRVGSKQDKFDMAFKRVSDLDE